MTDYTLASDIRRAVAKLRMRGARPFAITGTYRGSASQGTLDLLIEEIGVGSAGRGGELPEGVYVWFEGVPFSVGKVSYGYVLIQARDGVDIYAGGPVHDNV